MDRPFIGLLSELVVPAGIVSGNEDAITFSTWVTANKLCAKVGMGYADS
jgi:hypothetical protein